METLRHAVIAYETEAAARARLAAHGYPPDIAAEIAVYLAQSTDLPAFMEEIRAALAAESLGVDFVELDALPDLLRRPPAPPGALILWGMTDGIRFYRGSSVAALARLHGIARYGSSPLAQHVCQDKFAALSLAAAAGLRHPPSLLLEGEATIAALGPAPAGTLFVKPNTLGAKIGIFADSRCDDAAAAGRLALRLWDRYGDRAVAQEYVAGDDVRVSFMDLGGALPDQLGIFRLAKDPGGETGGAFMTMKDNETLSGARDTAGGRGEFGATRAAAFVPSMADLRQEPAAAGAVAAIADAAARLARLIGLSDCFSMDFRLPPQGGPVFLEYEVCPAVTIYDFQTYLRDRHGLSLGAALARSFRLAHARHGGRGEV